MAGRDDRDRNSLPATSTSYLAATGGGFSGLRAAWNGDLGYAPVEPEMRRMRRAVPAEFRLGASVGLGHHRVYGRSLALYLMASA